jgi:hypothetical protein
MYAYGGESSRRYNPRPMKEGSCNYDGGTLGGLGWNEGKVSKCKEGENILYL